MRTFIKILVATLTILIIIASCGNTPSPSNNDIYYNTKIKRIGGCQYVLASRASYSTAIVHHGACDNYKHKD